MSDEKHKKDMEELEKVMDDLSEDFAKSDLAKLSPEERDKLIREELEAYRRCKREQKGKTIH